MSPLFATQVERATAAAGVVDLARLGELVSAEYEQAERDHRELRAQNLRFNAALNNMSQALLMFDASGRLAIYNTRYEEMYGLWPGTVRAGMTVRELLELRRAAGFYNGDIDRDIATLMTCVRSGKTHNRLSDLPDGRTIALVSHPMADGGWVVTHEDITERRRAEKQIAHMARHDALTDLPNRVLLRERLAEALARVSHGQRLAVHYLDLDLFKGVNDTLGHQAGDELLTAVAERLRGCVGEDDTVARVGGDEFAVIQVDIERPEDAAALARRICETLKAPYDLGGHGVMVDTSIGLAIAPDDGIEPNELLKNADMALYGAKSDGRGTFCFFEPDMDARVKTRRALEIALRRALAASEFELYYQPLVDLADGSITCCEALIRWHHPKRGMVAPAEFIPLAEEIGLIVAIGEWVLRKACEDAATWPAPIKVAVNLSSIQLAHPNLVSIIVSALSCAGLPADRLEIEITESMLMQNSETTLATLHSLRQLGVRISMDDFGTGYSSLSYLRSFPFDKIKIDRCFISGLPYGEEAVAIVRAVAGLAKNLKMITTAEGIETQEQMDQVRALGCTEMQGFLFSRPRPHAELAALLPRPHFAMTA